MPTDGDITLFVGGQSISGWQSVRITRGIERCPNDFDISFTELFPGDGSTVVVKPGDFCKVFIGSDLVITGYVDRLNPSIDPQSHTVRITGRGKCQDLVDCAAEWPGGQISGSSILQIAQKLAEPYGKDDKGVPISEDSLITVTAVDSTVGPPIPQFNLIYGETAYEIIERVCRYRGLLAYELPDGNLFLGRVSDMTAASGFTQGDNIQAANIEYAMDQRFSMYQARLLSMELWGDIPGPGGSYKDTQYDFPDPSVLRRRLKILIAETADVGMEICKLRARWEASRRAGRSSTLSLVVDSWRDKGGTLWTPNTLVPLDVATCKIPQGTMWTIGAVTYRRDENGTTAELTIMPPGAFLPEPPQPMPAFWDYHR